MHHTATHCNPRIQKTVLATLLYAVLCVPTASAVILHVTTDAAGDGVGHINVTGEQFSEVAMPIYESFSSGTQRGYSWGGVGLKIGGKNVTFTNTSLFDYEGNNLDRSAQFIGDGNGMGIRSTNAQGDQPWLVDGKEGFGWTANQDLDFSGFTVRTGWNNNNYNQPERAMTVSSSAWVNLNGVDSYSGIEYDPSAGAFLISNAPNTASADHLITVKELVGDSGPSLNVPKGVEITFQNKVEDGTEGFALLNVAFDEPSKGHYVDIPEPQIYGLIVAVISLSLAVVRRRR
ncbi:MAG: hypothetical protein ISR40_03355 [Puniceicoccaceae bacterium]|nr:hypothetical protein [Puniceicoccaceae bacterium]